MAMRPPSARGAVLVVDSLSLPFEVALTQLPPSLEEELCLQVETAGVEFASCSGK